VDEKSIQILSHVGTTNAWEERRKIVELMLNRSVEDLREQRELQGTSLGVIRPKEITRFRMEEEAEKGWSPEQLAKLDRQDLFSPRLVPLLEKIPFRFSYDFICDDPRCGGHTMQVFDWEVAQSYRKWSRGKMRSEWEKQIRDTYDYKVRHMYDTLFFLGTLAAHPTTWTIGGIFFALKARPQEPQVPQPSLWPD